MKLILRWAALLYPRAWRERYGDELDCLIEDAPARWRDVADLARGGIHMHLMRPGFGMMVALLALAGGLVGGVAAWTMPERFMAIGIAGIRGRTAGDRGFTDRVQKSFQSAMRSEALQEIIKRHDLYRAERMSQPPEMVLDRMRRDIGLSVVSRRAAFSIQFFYPDRAKARAVTQDLLARMVAGDLELRTSGEVARLEVWENPGLPAAPVSPNKTVVLSAGLLGGAVLGVAIGGIRRMAARRRKKEGGRWVTCPKGGWKRT